MNLLSKSSYKSISESTSAFASIHLLQNSLISKLLWWSNLDCAYHLGYTEPTYFHLIYSFITSYSFFIPFILIYFYIFLFIFIIFIYLLFGSPIFGALCFPSILLFTWLPFNLSLCLVACIQQTSTLRSRCVIKWMPVQWIIFRKVSSSEIERVRTSWWLWSSIERGSKRGSKRVLFRFLKRLWQVGRLFGLFIQYYRVNTMELLVCWIVHAGSANRIGCEELKSLALDIVWT